MFIVIDGIDGAGKTTLANLLAELLKNRRPLVTKEPTNESEWGKRLRDSARLGRLPRDVEIEYFHKDRLAHLERTIRPALLEGRVVIADRYVDSTLAFQASSPSDADKLYGQLAPEILIPDVTFLLDCPVDFGLARIKRRKGKLTQFEKPETLKRAKQIYDSRRGDHYVHINASGSVENTLEQAKRVLRDRFPSVLGENPNSQKFDSDEPGNSERVVFG
ncbi:MAG: dTMP kinase [Alphaproteobacteria bacterium]|nr:dTMP kinase [Alphaproteobacteria bacterium]